MFSGVAGCAFEAAHAIPYVADLLLQGMAEQLHEDKQTIQADETKPRCWLASALKYCFVHRVGPEKRQETCIVSTLGGITLVLMKLHGAAHQFFV